MSYGPYVESSKRLNPGELGAFLLPYRQYKGKNRIICRDDILGMYMRCL